MGLTWESGHDLGGRALFSSAGYHGLTTECLLPAALLGPGEIIPSFPERSRWPATAVNKVVDRWTFWAPRTPEMDEGSWHATEGGIGNQVSESHTHSPPVASRAQDHVQALCDGPQWLQCDPAQEREMKHRHKLPWYKAVY